MYDRYDWRKGRYVSYDYQPKGDRFSRGLSDKPRVYTTVTHGETGRRFFRRTHTTDAKYLTVSSLLKSLGPKGKEGLEDICLYFRLEEGRLELDHEPPGTPLRFTTTQQRLGRRLWFLCPHCARRVGKLYFVKLTVYEVVGCQKCLGLSYPSQARHKCPARDRAIIERKIQVGFKAWMAAHEREQRRMMKLLVFAEGLMSNLGRKRRSR